MRDSSLSDEDRIRPIINGDLWQFVEPEFSVDSDTLNVVSDLLERSDAVTRRAALNGLSLSRSPSFVPVYIERLTNDPSPELRAHLLRLLSEHRSLPEVEITLEAAAADDPSDDVRAEAARILVGADAGD